MSPSSSIAQRRSWQDTRIIARDAKGTSANPSGPILVVLAVGLGGRFGGDKQIAALGPNGEWLVESTIHDAIAAGFTRIVLVMREAMRDVLVRLLMPHLEGRAELVFVVQTPDSVAGGCLAPAGRHKPLGTGHAVWCSRAAIDRPFAVVNADDSYDAAALALLAGHFARAVGPPMVGCRMDRTVSAHGGVNRGLCTVGADDDRADIAEYADVRRSDDGPTRLDPHRGRQPLAADAIVSLNYWGTLPDFLPTLEAGLRDFRRAAGADDEYFLPGAIDRFLEQGCQPLRVLRSDDDWLGVTYPDDVMRVVACLAALHARGVYPSRLCV